MPLVRWPESVENAAADLAGDAKDSLLLLEPGPDLYDFFAR